MTTMPTTAEVRLPFEVIPDRSETLQETAIARAVRSVREHLGMEIAYVSEFVGDRTVFREVDAPGLEHLIKVGDSQCLDDVYCRHIIEGRLPNLMGDTADVPFAAAMPITGAVPIGKHMSIPLRLAGGEVYGMFCCLGPKADQSLNDRDLQTMKVFADFVAHEVRKEVETKRAKEAKLERITKVISDGQISIVYQPICDIRNGVVTGFECLSRFAGEPYRTPDVWFKEASDVERGAVLEMSAIALALRALKSLPPHIYLGVNASPETVLADDFATAFDDVQVERIVLEITEHAVVRDYDKLMRVIDPLRQRGMRLAVDDAGAGYSGLQHILKLRPDLIKLDLALTRNIDTDLTRRALAAALVNFSVATNCEIIAEGIETETELQTLRGLGVTHGQGYFLGRPSSLGDALCSVEFGLSNRESSNGRRESTTSPVPMSSSTRKVCGWEYGHV